MTKLQLVTRVAERLGDTSADHLTDLRYIFEAVLGELASEGVIRSLNRNATYAFVASQRTYDTQTVTGLTAPDYPMDISRIVVPVWGAEGWLERKDDEEFEWIRLGATDDAGAGFENRPRIWRLYPNEQTLEFWPVPDSDSDDVDFIVTYLKPPAALADGDNIVEIRAEHLHTVIAGMVKHGLVFQDEVIIDRPTAIREFAEGIKRMRAATWREAGRDRRTRNSDFIYTREAWRRNGWR